MIKPSSRPHFHGCILSAIAALLAMPTPRALAQVQSPPPPPPAAAAEEDVILLTPFTVDTTRDRGYQAENTLSGSRLNSSLNDTPASVSVFTQEFLQDVGLTELNELVEYSVNAQLNFNDMGPELNANSYVNATALVRKIDVRGLPASQGMDYFRSITPDDSYRIGRYDESRGPNGILFGISDTGGLINQTSKGANLRRNRAMVRYQSGTEDRSRIEFDANRVLIDGKLAVLVAALDQENGGWQIGEFQDKERIFASIATRPIRSLSINIMGETGREHRSILNPFTPGDEGLAWYDNLGARGVNAVSFAPLGQNPTAAQQAVGVVSRNGAFNATTRRITFIENNGTLFNSAGTYLTGSYNNPTVRAPDGTPGVAGTTLRINDPAFMPYEVNAGGPGMQRVQSLKNYTVMADWEPLKNLFVNLGHNYQATNARAWFVNGANPFLRGDPNTTLGVRGPQNPYAGQLYFDSSWKRDDHVARYEDTRLSLSYLFDTRRFGTHRLAAMGSRVEERDTRTGTWQGLAGAPFAAAAEGVNNRVVTRAYLQPGNPESFRLPDWRSVPSSMDIDGTTYDVTWVNQSGGNNNAHATQTVDTRLIVAQSHFFNRKLVTTVGYREDDAKITSFGHRQDPVLKMDIIDPDLAKAVVNDTRGITRTQGVVYHALKNVSLLANASTSVALPDFTRKVFPDAKVPDPAKGRGEDIGVSVQLFDRKLVAKAVYFTTKEEGNSNAGQNIFVNANEDVTDALGTVLAAPAGPISQADWARRRAELNPDVTGILYDIESKGYELSATANPTPNWRVTLSYSYTDRIQSNRFIRDAVPWYGFKVENGLIREGVRRNADGTFTVDPSAFESTGTVATWLELARMRNEANLSTLVTANSITAAEELFNVIDTMNDEKRENEQRWGLRPHRASFFTAYDFTQGRLKGFTMGGGYRWRSPNIIGLTAGGAELKGRAIEAADLMLRYRRRLSDGGLRGNLVFQVNVMNLFDQGGIIPTHLSSTPEFVVPGGRGIGYSRFGLIAPRSFRFTTTYEF